jgi:hypothetical protein
MALTLSSLLLLHISTRYGPHTIATTTTTTTAHIYAIYVTTLSIPTNFSPDHSFTSAQCTFCYNVLRTFLNTSIKKHTDKYLQSKKKAKMLCAFISTYTFCTFLVVVIKYFKDKVRNGMISIIVWSWQSFLLSTLFLAVHLQTFTFRLLLTYLMCI